MPLIFLPRRRFGSSGLGFASGTLLANEKYEFIADLGAQLTVRAPPATRSSRIQAAILDVYLGIISGEGVATTLFVRGTETARPKPNHSSYLPAQVEVYLGSSAYNETHYSNFERFV